MQAPVLYPIGTTQACLFASKLLKKMGITVTDHPSPDVTALLLDVPSFRSDGLLRSGENVHTYLERLPSRLQIFCGNPKNCIPKDHHIMDLLKDPEYLAQNAAITASCALMLAAQKLPVVLPQASILVIGWGRIGKSLAKQLKAMGADPVVAVRKESDLAILKMLGYRCTPISTLRKQIPGIRLVLNTVPAPVLKDEDFPQGGDCLKIDLASQPGILCADTVQARGLPGTYAPESSGRLIADTVFRLLMEETQ